MTPAAAGMSSQVSACYEINSRAGSEGSPVSSFKCDRPSHPDWGRLGVLRAAGADNRWQGQRSYRRAALWHPARETRQLSWTLYIYSMNHRVRGEKHTGPGLGLSAGGD